MILIQVLESPSKGLFTQTNLPFSLLPLLFPSSIHFIIIRQGYPVGPACGVFHLLFNSLIIEIDGARIQIVGPYKFEQVSFANVLKQG